MGEYAPAHVPERLRAASTREPLKPLLITQPEGPSFTLDGNLLRWQNWSLRIGFNYREGDDPAHRALSRRRPRALDRPPNVVRGDDRPYRDSSPDHYRRTAFDIGEWGLGFMTTSLELGCDCLGEIRYLDAVMHDSTGGPYTITNAICIHEEDGAVLWKHVDHDSGAEVRRIRRLTISFHVTVANYEYLVYWRLYQDGNIECEVRATGIMVTTPLAPGAPNPNGTLVDERTYAPFHQHFLVARLDMDVDGSDNTVVMSESYAEPMGPDNPYGLSLVTRNVPLRSESEGMQDVSFDTQRAWKVVNPQRDQRVGHPSRLQAGARWRHPGDVRPRLAGSQARQRDRTHPVGNPEFRRRALARRRIRQPVGGGHRPGTVDEGQPAHREHRRRALVRVRPAPHHPTRGLAGDAGRRRLLLAQAVRILRPQPVAGRARHPVRRLPRPELTPVKFSGENGIAKERP